MASWGHKGVPGPEGPQHHLRSVVRRILALGGVFTPIMLKALQKMDSRVCRSLTALKVCDSPIQAIMPHGLES